MECRYILLKSEYESTVTFGIAVAVDCDERVTILDSYMDLSSNQSKVTELIELCNALKLDPIHLSDVVDDFLSSL